MSFIEAYKRLEKLCGEIFDDDRRVSAYIDEMVSTPRGAHFVKGWDEDLKQLKHYRWVRNQIVHNPGSSEENMCDLADTQWLLDFYSRIMNQTDPLALYRKATQSQHKSAPKNVDVQYYQERPEIYYNKYETRRGLSGFEIALIIVAAVVTVAVAWLLFK